MSGPPKPPGGFVPRPPGNPPLPPGFKIPPGVAPPMPPGMAAPPGGPPPHWKGPVNPPQGYPQPPQGYSQPPQGYPQPPQGHSQPPQGYPQPPQGYSQPPQGYPKPPQGYSQPPQGYPQPPQGHTQPPQGYPQPPQGHTQPPQGYPKPPQGHSQPPQGYPQPPQGHLQPPQGYPQHPQGYTKHPQGYPQPPQGHSQPPQGYPQPPQGHSQPPQGYPKPPQGHTQPPQGHSQPPQGYPQHPHGYPPHPQGYSQSPEGYPQPPGNRPYPPVPSATRPSADTYPPGSSSYAPYPQASTYGASPVLNAGDQRGDRPMRMARREEDMRDPTNTVWVGNLDPQEHSEDVLRREFREFGKVMRIARVPDKSYCFVHFRRVEEAHQAVETLSARGTLGRARFNYGKMFEYTQEEMDAPYDPNFRPQRRAREEDNTDDRRRRPRREERIEEPTNVLWLGGLPPTVSIEEIQENFKVFGTITNISRLESRNMAFIHFDTVESCTQALDLMRDQTIGGARISLNYGRSQRSTTAPEELTSDGFPRNETPTNVVYLGQFSSDVTEQDIEDLFEPFEGFINSKLIQSSGIAFGHFDTIEHGCIARVALSNALLRGAPMRISFGKSNHTLSVADRMREGKPAPLGGNSGNAGVGGSDDLVGTAVSSDGFNGALIAGPGVPFADPNGTSALVTLPGMGTMVGARAVPQGPTFFSRDRPVPDMTLDARLQSLLGATYNNSGEADKALSPGVIQTICDFVDGCIDENTARQLDETILLYTPLSATHVFGILAKRMYEFFNDDPYKKLLIIYAATRVLLGAKTDFHFFTKASLNAFLMTLFVASEGQTPSGMEVFTSILENLRRHPFIEQQNLDTDFVDVFRDQLDEILRRAKVDQDLASLMKKKKKR